MTKAFKANSSRIKPSASLLGRAMNYEPKTGGSREIETMIHDFSKNCS